MFTEGFEKHAGLKHILTAAMMAASPAKAHAAGSAADALKTGLRAAQNTQTGQQVTSNVSQYLKKAQKIKLLGSSTPTPSASGLSTAAQQSSKGANLYLKDGKQLQFDYGRFSAAAKPKEVRADLDLGKGFGIGASKSGGENKAGVFWKKEF